MKFSGSSTVVLSCLGNAVNRSWRWRPNTGLGNGNVRITMVEPGENTVDTRQITDIPEALTDHHCSVKSAWSKNV
ncbi:hypothetical protein SK128_001175 [Halocaridina rubra]